MSFGHMLWRRSKQDGIEFLSTSTKTATVKKINQFLQIKNIFIFLPKYCFIDYLAALVVLTRRHKRKDIVLIA
jgi:hypothetical protein